MAGGENNAAMSNQLRSNISLPFKNLLVVRETERWDVHQFFGQFFPPGLFLELSGVVVGVDVVQVRGHLGPQLLLDEEHLHAAVEEFGAEAVLPVKKKSSFHIGQEKGFSNSS